jgi:hypothetical protein
MNIRNFGNWRKPVIVINTIDLGITLRNGMAFQSFNGSIEVKLNSIYPFATNGLFTRQKGNLLPSPILMQDLHFHGSPPTRLIKSMLRCFWDRNIREMGNKVRKQRQRISEYELTYRMLGSTAKSNRLGITVAMIYVMLTISNPPMAKEPIAAITMTSHH